MSSSKQVYSIGNFNLVVNYSVESEADIEKITKAMENNFQYSEEGNFKLPKITLNVVKSKDALNTIKNIIGSSKYEETTGYYNQDFLHYEDEDAVYNYCVKDGICVVKNKSDGSVSYYYDENLPEKQIAEIPVCLARELIIKANMSKGNYILHSSSFEKNGNGFVMVGQGGAGKTSLMISYLKSHDGIKYVSNDINFVSKDGEMMYPFQIPMLLSSDTAESYFGEKTKTFGSDQVISYFHKNLGRQVTKFKFPTKQVEELFNTTATGASSITGVIIPKFGKDNKGITVEPLSKEEAKEIILSQILDFDDRFKVDYLNLVEGEVKYDKEALAEKLASECEIVRINFGVDVYEEENLKKLNGILDELIVANNAKRQARIQAKQEAENKVINSENQIFGDDKLARVSTELLKVQPELQKGKKRYELHCHTTASDGKISPTQLVDLAERHGITTLAITDHNSVNGSLEAQEYIKKTGKNIQVINGVEIDANDFSMFHLLAYGVKDMDKMKKYLDNLEAQNQEVMLKIISNLQKNGVPDITPEAVIKLSGKPNIQKIHIINFLRGNGYAKDRYEVQEKFLGKHCPSYVPRVQPTAQEVIDLIHDCGGICVLAHPMELAKMNPEQLKSMKDVEKLIVAMKEMGLDGVECMSPKHTPEEEQHLYNFCEKQGLVQTKGNDYHAKPGQKFGSLESKFKDKLLETINPEIKKIKGE